MPTIITRDQWSDVRPQWSPLTLPSPKAILHHQGGPFTKSASLEDLKAALRGIEDYEIRQGYIAIAYHWWVVNGGPFDGLIFELRPAGVWGGATYRQNGVSHAVCVSGDFTFDTLTPKAFDSVCYLFARMMKAGQIVNDVAVSPHSLYYPTACPGIKLKAEMPRINTEVHNRVRPVDWAAIIAIAKWVLRVKNKPLKQGDRGPDVQIMIDLLISKGFNQTGPGNAYGVKAAAAVHAFKVARRWQRRFEVAPDGSGFGGVAAIEILK